MGLRYPALVLSALASCAFCACGSGSDSELFGPGTGASPSGGAAGSAGATGGRMSTGGTSNTGGASGAGGASGGGGMAPTDGGGAATSAGGSSSGGSIGAGGGPSTDAGTPGVIECAGMPCTIAGLPTNICCYGGLTTSCFPSFPGCANFGSPIACDDRADCAGGQVCCGGLPLGFGCVASCPNGLQLCRTDDECASGHTCQPLMNAPAYSACM